MMLHNTSAIISGGHDSDRTILAEILRSGGMRDMRATAGADDALVMACQRAPSVIVLGAEHPSLALAAVRTFRACPHDLVRRLPIIVATSQATLSQAVALRDAGVDEVVLRPHTAAKLLARIDAATTYRRDFIDAGSYVGPDRRRDPSVAYTGPFRRASDAALDILEIA